MVRPGRAVIRVGFVYPYYGEYWLGGVNYLRNLLGAVAATPECGVAPVLVLQARARMPPGFEGVEIARSLMLHLRDALEVRGLWRHLGADPLLDRILVYHRLAAVSHSGVLGPRARTPALAWIPDLQHRVLPAFFQPQDLAARDAAMNRALRQATRVILSSDAARQDVDHYFPGYSEKLRVLRFVDSSSMTDGPSREALEARHGFSGPYLLVPNQYWAHKNHPLVLEALAILERSGRRVLVLSTGSASDYRNPQYFEGLMRRRAELAIEDRYRVLGVVPFPELAGLLRHAVAIVNPSLFEGWSTTVEEAKSLGKRVLLSDIPVHREQAPERSVYFDPASAEQLAEAMWAAWTGHDPREDAAAAVRAAASLQARRRAFAEAYAAIVHEVTG